MQTPQKKSDNQTIHTENKIFNFREIWAVTLDRPVGLYALPSHGIRSYGLPCVVVHSKALQTSAVPRADCREAVLSSLLKQVCLDFPLLHRPVSYRSGARKGEG